MKNYDEVKNLSMEAINVLADKKDFNEAAGIGVLLIKAWKARETNLSEEEIGAYFYYLLFGFRITKSYC